ncbi:MAG: TetR/AcrR family transcriptional regulator [Desulfobacula sp.]|nr:TetR/AcrR family transcriptional regulator [Desulfobacula sp.]
MEEIKRVRMSGKERRKQIIDVSRNLFAKEKYQKTTMATIAKEIGVTEPLIYRHFKNKKELFLTILKEDHEAIAFITYDFLKKKGNAIELYQGLFNVILHNMKQDPQLAKITILATSIEDKDIRSQIRFFDKTIENVITQDLKNRGRDLGVSLNFRPEVIARIFISLMVGRAHLIMIEKEGNIDSIFHESMALMFSNSTI